MRDWSLSEELYRAFHAWPVILAFCLVGGLLGWGISYLWPTAYRTQAQVFVGLNPYRTFEDAQFTALNKPEYTNVDDYKNWQMSQLSGAIFLDEVIKETLQGLRQNDEYWNGISADQFTALLRADWRTAGIWSLVAEASSAKRSNQAVREWSRTAVKSVNAAIAAAQQAARADAALQNVQKEQLKVRLDRERYLAAQKSIAAWLDAAAARPAGQAVDQSERLQMANWAAAAAQYSPAWTKLLATQPSAAAPLAEHTDWLTRVLAANQAEVEALDQRLDLLSQQHDSLEKQYTAVNEQSLGLSPNLVIKDFEKFQPEVIRPTWLLVLLGSLAGLLAWVVFTLIKVTRRKLQP